jgi:positive regulator of sigma E activity
MNQLVRHGAVVESWADGLALLRLLPGADAGCAACGARRICSLRPSAAGEAAAVASERPLRAGQRVTVALPAHADRHAAILAFFLPTAVVLAGLGLGLALGWGEAPAALSGLGALAAYGLVLAACRRRLAEAFRPLLADPGGDAP